MRPGPVADSSALPARPKPLPTNPEPPHAPPPSAVPTPQGDPHKLAPNGELVVNANQFVVHSWAIARK